MKSGKILIQILFQSINNVPIIRFIQVKLMSIYNNYITMPLTMQIVLTYNNLSFFITIKLSQLPYYKLTKIKISTQ